MCSSKSIANYGQLGGQYPGEFMMGLTKWVRVFKFLGKRLALSLWEGLDEPQGLCKPLAKARGRASRGQKGGSKACIFAADRVNNIIRGRSKKFSNN